MRDCSIAYGNFGILTILPQLISYQMLKDTLRNQKENPDLHLLIHQLAINLIRLKTTVLNLIYLYEKIQCAMNLSQLAHTESPDQWLKKK